MTIESLDPQIKALTDHVGEFIDYWGFKAIEGKIWCLTYISEKPLGPSDYIEAFGISKGLVSQCVKRLVEYDVLIELSEPGKKKQFYKTNDDLVSVIKNVLKMRELHILESVESTARKIEKQGTAKLGKQGFNMDKVVQLGDLTETTKSLLAMFVEDDSHPLFQ